MNYVIGVSRNNSVDSASNQQQSNGLRTFRPGPAAAKNLTGSPSRAAPPNLADLDFPPPPTELPPELPPPAERRPPIPSSPRAVRAEKPLPQVPYSFLPFHVRSIFVGTYIWKVTGKKKPVCTEFLFHLCNSSIGSKLIVCWGHTIQTFRLIPWSVHQDSITAQLMGWRSGKLFLCSSSLYHAKVKIMLCPVQSLLSNSPFEVRKIINISI